MTTKHTTKTDGNGLTQMGWSITVDTSHEADAIRQAIASTTPSTHAPPLWSTEEPQKPEGL